jgi:RsiW-degrading membrane proteinase PrsW (M82 family)
MIVELLFYAFVVGAIIATVVYFGDRFEREPLFRIFNAMVLGIFATVIVIIVKKVIPLPNYAPVLSFGNTILVNFLSVGFVEEMAKFFMILFFIYKWEDFNEYFDGPLYAGLVGVGFAISENLMYMIKPLAGLIASDISLNPDEARLIALNVLVKFRLYPGHFLFGFIAGYFIAKAKFRKEEAKFKEILYLGVGFLIAIFMHGTYNAIAIMGSLTLFQVYVLFLFLIALFVGWKSKKKSVFRTEILDKLPERKRNKLKDILLVKKEEKITVSYVIMLCILLLVCQFIVYFLTTAILSF